jgi:predicted glutamine amidotransferase
MCGLVVARSLKKGHTGQKVYSLYKKQEKRGKRGFGYVAIKDGKLSKIYRSTTEDGIKKYLLKDRSDMILFHHRLPTSTVNTLGTTHPMSVEHDELGYDYIFAHNGIINNANHLKGKHEDIGYLYKTEMRDITYTEYINVKDSDGKNAKELSEAVSATKFNDSESLAIELAMYIEGKTQRVRTFGPVAFWGLSLYKGTNRVHKIYYGRNEGRELNSSKNNKWFSVASETGSEVDSMKLHVYDYKSSNVEKTDLEIDSAQPVQYGYRNNSTTSVTQYDSSKKKKTESLLSATLQNAYYTYKEAIDSGVPFNEFHRIERGGCFFYVPVKFLGVDVVSRGHYKEPVTEVIPDTQPSDIYSEKVIERIEELSLKYAKVEKAIEETYEYENYGTIDSSYFKEEEQRLYLDLEKVEDEISLMNLDENTQDFFLEKARQLVDKK